MTSKARNVAHLSECYNHYCGNKTNAMDGEVLSKFNKLTTIGIAIWFVPDRFRLGYGKTKLAEFCISPMNKANNPMICEETTSDPPSLPQIIDSNHIDSHFGGNGIAATDEESETPNKEYPTPITTACHNP